MSRRSVWKHRNWLAPVHCNVLASAWSLTTAPCLPQEPNTHITPPCDSFLLIKEVSSCVQGWRVFAGVRRTQDGDALVRDGPAPAPSSASASTGAGQIVPVIMDVTSDELVATAMQVIGAQLRESGSNLRGLVNNAGKGVFLPLEVSWWTGVRTGGRVPFKHSLN